MRNVIWFAALQLADATTSTTLPLTTVSRKGIDGNTGFELVLSEASGLPLGALSNVQYGLGRSAQLGTAGFVPCEVNGTDLNNRMPTVLHSPDGQPIEEIGLTISHVDPGAQGATVYVGYIQRPQRPQRKR